MKTPEQMKIEAVAGSIATYQKALETQYKALGVSYTNIISALVQNYAAGLIQANGLLEMEDVSPQADL